MTDDLLKLFEFCTTHDIGFDYIHSQTKSKNSIDYFEIEKKVVISIYDPDDEFLGDLISKKIEELKKFVN